MSIEITPEQLAGIDSEAAKWLQQGLSTEPCDVAQANKAITWLYENLFKRPCPEIAWYDGPNQALADHPEAEQEAIKGALYVSPLWYLWTIYRIVAAQQLQIKHNISQELLDNFLGMMRNIGIVGLFENKVIVLQRPVGMIFDSEGQLHNEHGPAIEYADGTKLYVWHGVNVPSSWITDKENLPIDTALTHTNIELRRVAGEIIGWGRIVSSLNPKVIDENENPMIGTLVEVDLPRAPNSRFLKVRCATGRDFALPVPSRFQTALEANADSYELTPEEFLSVQLRT